MHLINKTEFELHVWKLSDDGYIYLALTDFNFGALFSLITEPTSVGLNVALREACKKSDSQAAEGEGLQESSYDFGIPEAIVTPYLCSGLLKGLKYSDGSYTASLSPP